MSHVIIALGGNRSGAWGAPPVTFRRALMELALRGVRVRATSRLYRSRPVGLPRQPWFWNAVADVEPGLAPAALLRLMKEIERRAGRRRIGSAGSRPLDLDLIDFNGLRLGRGRGRRQAGRLELPHPEAHRRLFVLCPLADVVPHWHHPRLQVRVSRIRARLPGRRNEVAPTLETWAGSWQ